jgi:uncharacterized protein Usg
MTSVQVVSRKGGRTVFAPQLLATTEVLYYLPDYPDILQSFTWQTLDEAPKFPRVQKFLDYWRAHIDAVIHSVRLSHPAVGADVVIRHADDMFRLN